MSTRIKFRSIVVLLGALALFCSACEFDVGTVDIKLVYSTDESKYPLDTSLVDTLRVTITGDDMETIVQEFDNPPASGGLSGIPLGKNRVVTVEGVRSGVVSRGISAPFETTAGTTKSYIFLSLVNEFSVLLTTVGLIDPEWTERYRTSMISGSEGKRAFHSATLLPSGEVLVAGGRVSFDGTDFIGRVNGEALRSIVRFDGYVGGFINEVDSGDCQTGLLCMRSDRAFHTADLLPGGEYVIFVGGEPADASFSAEAYKISSKTFIPAGDLNRPRSRNASAILSDESVVIAGGIENMSSDLTDSFELYSGTSFIESEDKLSQPRLGSVAVAYPGGVLVIGGWQAWGDPAERQASAIVDRIKFDGGDLIVDRIADLNHARADHTAVLLKDTGGPQILVCGGRSDDTTIVSTCEIIDPIIGESTDSIDFARWGHTSTVLNDGRILFTGGFTSTGFSLSANNTALVLDFLGPDFMVQMVSARAGHSATLLSNGMVVLIGGVSLLSDGNLDWAAQDYEIFNPK